ncbi:translation initiation factor IF-2 N-terminal domain-containing protein, partial [Corynebacterium sp. UBA2622]|uniref:translation initiation factor IF-2 N-terminal domain-containing protein n=1 Tax=Corynebacterium sp. UBA2622 TaxID=1946393 RepID=UPI0025C4D218
MPGKLRVHELAKQLGVTSKELLATLKEQGEFVKTASSTIEPPVVKKMRSFYGEKSGGGQTDTKSGSAAPQAGAPKPGGPKPGAPKPAAKAAEAAASATAATGGAKPGAAKPAASKPAPAAAKPAAAKPGTPASPKGAPQAPAATNA